MREREEDTNEPAPDAKRAEGSPELAATVAAPGLENQMAVAYAPLVSMEAPVAASEENQLAIVNAPQLTTDACLTYVREVNKYFKDDIEKCLEFATVMKDSMARRVDAAGTFHRVKELFQGHRHLIMGFNAFFPEEQKIPVPEEEPDMEQEATTIFKHKIRSLGEDVYQEFGVILQLYQQRKKTINEVYQYVAATLADHSELLAEFRTFLPDVNTSTIPTRSDQMTIAVKRARSASKVVVGGKRRISDGENLVAKVPGETSRPREPERRAAKARKINEKILDKAQQLAGKALKKNEKIGKIEEDMSRPYKKEKTSTSIRREELSLRGRNKEATSVLGTESLQPQRVSARNLAKRARLQSFFLDDGHELPSLAEVEQRTENCWHKWKGW